MIDGSNKQSIGARTERNSPAKISCSGIYPHGFESLTQHECSHIYRFIAEFNKHYYLSARRRACQ